jgi:hypothetical protein
MKKAEHYVLLVLSWLTLTNALAQKVTEFKTKFGKLSNEETKMTVYAKDSNAAAVILFDKASLDYNLNPVANNNALFDANFRRHKRVKIFKKEGYGMADVQILFPEWIRVADLKVSSYNLEGGKWVETKMTKESVFDETLNKWQKVKKFTVPQVREGSIIEYEYTLFADGGGFIPSWTFQREVPTIWSEYEINTPEYTEYVVTPYHNQPFLVQEDERRAAADTYQGTRIAWMNRHVRWVQKDVPALKPEPMMTSITNYWSRVHFQYSGHYSLQLERVIDEIRIVRGLFKPAANTWNKLGEALIKEESFGDALKHSATLETVQSLTAGLTEPKDKIAAIYNHIGKNYEVYHYNNFTLSQTLRELLQKHKGTETDLNLLAINMLRHAGIEAYPVLISTRSNGQLNPIYPVHERINRVIAYMVLDNEPFFLDASAYPMPLSLLHFEDLNGDGLLIQAKDKTSWVNVKSKLNTKSLFQNQLILNENGVLSGTVALSATGYDALKGRNEIEKEGADKYANELLKNLLVEGKLEAQTFENTDKTDEKHLKGLFKIQTTAYITKTDSFMYVLPLLFWAEKENLFKNPERLFDVDYGYTRENSYILNLTIPNGYKVESIPKNAKLNFADNGIIFTYVAEAAGNQLKINVKWSIKRTVFAVSEYAALSKAYETILNKMVEQIVLSKI